MLIGWYDMDSGHSVDGKGWIGLANEERKTNRSPVSGVEVNAL